MRIAIVPSVIIIIIAFARVGPAQDSFSIPLGQLVDEAGVGRFEMDPLFLGLDNINEQLHIGDIVGSANATIVPEVKVLGETIIPKVTGDTRTGARVTGTVTGRAGLELNAHFDIGGIGPSANFQYTPTLNPPQTFYAGELVNLNPRNGLNSDGDFTKSDVQLPSAGVSLDVIFDIHAAGKVDYGLVGVVPYNSEPFDFPIKQPKDEDGSNFTLIGMGVDLNDQENFGSLTVAGEQIGIDPGANGTLFKFQIKLDPTPPPLDGGDPLFHRDIGEVALVKPELGNTLLVDTTLADERISYAIDSKIARLGVDIDGIASALAAGNSYTRFSKTLGDPDSDFNATLSGELVDLKYGPEIGFRYESVVDTEFDVDIKFSKAVAVVNENGTRITDSLTAADWNELPQIAVLGEEEVTANVTFTHADFVLHEQHAVTISDYLEFNALSLNANINVASLPIPVKSLGPVLHERTSVLEHIDFPDIPELPQVGQAQVPDPFAPIRSAKTVLDVIGEIKLRKPAPKTLTSITWDEGEQPTKTFALQPQPSEVVFWRERRGWERLSDGAGVNPDAQSKLVFGTAPNGGQIESELDLTPWATSTFDEAGIDELDIVAQSVKIPDGTLVRVPSDNRWTTNRLENHGELEFQRSSQRSTFNAAGSGILTVGGTAEINFDHQAAEFNANIFVHEAGHTMKFPINVNGTSHRFNVDQSFINHGIIELDFDANELSLSSELINTGVLQVANTHLSINTPFVKNDGVISAIGGEAADGSISLSTGTELSGSGEWLVNEGGNITFGTSSTTSPDQPPAPPTLIPVGSSLSFAVPDGVMDFRKRLEVRGNAGFFVEENGTLNLNGLSPLENSNVELVNRGTVNITGPVVISDGGQDSPARLEPINLDNAGGTIRIHEWGSLSFDAKITNYAEGGVTFDAGKFELVGAPTRWENDDITSIPSNTGVASLIYRVVGVGDDGTLGEVDFEGDPGYSVDDFDTALTINASDVTLSGAALFPNLNTIESNRGRLRLEKGIMFNTVGSLTNTGDIEVGANSNLVVRGDLLLHGGKLTIEPSLPNATDDLGTDRGGLFVESGKIEVVGAELNVVPGGITLVSSMGVDRENNTLSGDWLVQESSTTALDQTTTVTPANVVGVAGPWGIEVLNGSAVIDGKDAAFDALRSLRMLNGNLEIRGGHEYRSLADDSEFLSAVPPKVIGMAEGSMLTVVHSGSMVAHGIEVSGDVTIGSNGSLSLEDALRTDSRNASQIIVDGVLHADRVAIGAQVPNQEFRSTLEGNGQIVSDVEIERGLLKPSNEEGLRIFGDLQLTAETITQFVLDSGNAQSRLAVNSATLSGALEVLAAPSFDPALDELVELITLNDDSSELVTGAFDKVSLPSTLTGKSFELSITEQGVFLDPYLLGDFNGDDRRSGTDINLLSSVARLAYDEQFDLNADGEVDQTDRVIWVEGLERTFFGDANLNGAVEFDDFLALSDNFGNFGGWRSGDFNGDQRVDFPDFLLLSENFGQTRAAMAVPEPTGQMLFLVVVMLIALRSHQALSHDA